MQDVFRGDGTCQTHFFRGWGGGGEGVAKLLMVGAIFAGGPGHVPSLPCPKSGPVCTYVVTIDTSRKLSTFIAFA